MSPSAMKEFVHALLQSLSPSSLASYMGNINRFMEWFGGVYGQLPRVPFGKFPMLLYIQSKVQQGVSFSTVENIIASWVWLFSTLGFSNPFQPAFLKAFLKGVKRVLARPIQRKKPVCAVIIDKVVKLCGHVDATLNDLRMCLFFVLGFAGFFRCQELLDIQIKHIFVASNFSYFRILVPKSKTNQYLRTGQDVVIASLGNDRCPLRLLMRLIEAANVYDPEMFLFQGLAHYARGIYHYNGRKLSYSAARSLVRQGLAKVGEDPALFGTHSLRAGGATAAAAQGVSERILQAHGRWACASSKDMYVHDSIANRMTVTANVFNVQ